MDLKVLHKISYGLYVVCSKNRKKINGQIVNTLFQVTAEPPQIAVSINKENLTHEYIEKSNSLTASILSQDTPMKFIDIFGFKSGRDINKFADINFKIGKLGIPIVLDNALAYIEAKVIDKIDVGTHTVFIGRVAEGKILNDYKPLTYEYYHKIKGGYSPKTAPTYSRVVDRKKGVIIDMKKYVCKICGYIYDPEKGDPENGIKPGTSFEELPDNWICPVCGAGKEEFEKEV